MSEPGRWKLLFLTSCQGLCEGHLPSSRLKLPHPKLPWSCSMNGPSASHTILPSRIKQQRIFFSLQMQPLTGAPGKGSQNNWIIPDKYEQELRRCVEEEPKVKFISVNWWSISLILFPCIQIRSYLKWPCLFQFVLNSQSHFPYMILSQLDEKCIQ